MVKTEKFWDLVIKGKQKVSILIDNPLPERVGKGKESYVGIPIAFEKGFLFIRTDDNNRLWGIVVKTDLILSVWIYR